MLDTVRNLDDGGIDAAALDAALEPPRAACRSTAWCTDWRTITRVPGVSQRGFPSSGVFRRENDILASAVDGVRLRLVLHAGIRDEDVERAIAVFAQLPAA